MNCLVPDWALAVLTAALLLLVSTPSQAAGTEETFRSTHFSITWDTENGSLNQTDDDGDSVPDGVERTAEAFERARALLSEELGFKAPPGEGLYPIYVADSSEGSNFTRFSPSGDSRSRSSYIVISVRTADPATPLDSIESVAAHEFMHAIQFGYDYLEDDWIMEATATWVQDLMVPSGSSTSGFLRESIPFPRESFAEPDHRYGAFLLFRFITERFAADDPGGAALVRSLWEAMAAPDSGSGAGLGSFEALDQLLNEQGSSLEDAWGEFLLWRWRLSSFQRGDLYREELRGLGWPRPTSTKTVRRESCRLTTNQGGSSLYPLAGDYVRLTPPRWVRSSRATLTVLGPAGATGFLILKGAQGASSEPVRFDSGGTFQKRVEIGSEATRRITLGLGNARLDERPIEIAYSVMMDGRNAVRASSVAEPGTTSAGVGVALSGSVTCGGEPSPATRLDLVRIGASGAEAERFPLVTDASGRWSLQTAPTENSTYRVEVRDPLVSFSQSAPFGVRVRVFVEASLDRDRVSAGSRVTVAGRVSPEHPGVPVQIQVRRPQGRWQAVAAVVTDGDSSTYSATLEPLPAGIWELKAVVGDTGDDDHLAGWSAPLLVKVLD